MTVLDLSSNDLSTLDPECFRANGVTGGIVGVFSSTDAPGRMRAAAQACRDAGLTLHGFYGLIYFGDAYGELRDTHWAIQLALEFGVGRVWLDCETDAVDNGWTQAPRPTPAQRVEAIRRAVAEIEAAGLSAGIYCVTPETLVLTSDLEWVAAGDLRQGDGLVGFDEEPCGSDGRGHRNARAWRPAVVTGYDRRVLPVWEIELEGGRTLRCSSEHRSLTSQAAGGRYQKVAWRTPEQLARRGVTRSFPRYLTPWTHDPSDFDAGFLAGAFDGEGCLCRRDWRLGFTQKANVLLAAVEERLMAKGFQWDNAHHRFGASGAVTIRLTGGLSETVRFLGEYRPPRLMDNWKREFAETTRQMRAKKHDRIVEVRYIGEREVAAISSSSQTYLANGYGAHNTGRWWWPGSTNNSTEFSELPLWHSEYGVSGSAHEPVHEVNYGGWTKVAVHQYASAIELCGRVRDHNYYWLEEEDVMTPVQLARLERIERIIAGNGIDVDGQRLTGEAALAFLDGDGASLALGQGMLQAHTHKVLPNPAGPVTGGPLYQ